MPLLLYQSFSLLSARLWLSVPLGITGFSLLFVSVFVEVLVPVFRNRIRLAPVDISPSVYGGVGGGAVLLAGAH